MGHTRSEIFELINPICQSEKIFLIEVVIHGSVKGNMVRVIVDTEEGVTLHQCQQLSKNISDLFYRRDLFEGNYRLEVTSPGLDKPLQEPYEYKRNIGKQIKVNYHIQKELNFNSIIYCLIGRFKIAQFCKFKSSN